MQIVLAMTAIIVIVGGQNLGSSAKIATMYFYMLIFEMTIVKRSARILAGLPAVCFCRKSRTFYKKPKIKNVLPFDLV